MLADEALQRSPIEHVGHHGARREQLLTDVLVETLLEPETERHAKALFPAPQKVGRKKALHELAEQVFLAPSRQLDIEFHLIQQLGKTMVEKWRPHFQAVRHAHPIDLDEHIVREAYGLLPQRHAAKRAKRIVEHGGEQGLITGWRCVLRQVRRNPGEVLASEHDLLLGDEAASRLEPGVFDVAGQMKAPHPQAVARG